MNPSATNNKLTINFMIIIIFIFIVNWLTLSFKKLFNLSLYMKPKVIIAIYRYIF